MTAALPPSVTPPDPDSYVRGGRWLLALLLLGVLCAALAGGGG